MRKREKREARRTRREIDQRPPKERELHCKETKSKEKKKERKGKDIIYGKKLVKLVREASLGNFASIR